MKNILLVLMIVCTAVLKAQTTIWNGTSWSNGSPSSTKDAIIAGNYDSSANISTRNLTINSGITYTIGDASRLLIYGNFINNGTIIVSNDAILNQISDTSTYSGTGNAIVRRVANLKRTDYNYWSSPVNGQNLYGFSPGTPVRYFTRYNEASDIFNNIGLDENSVFEPGVGYSIRGKSDYSLTVPQTETFSFRGRLNNGDITVILKRSPGLDKGYNLIGNPYPSNIALKYLFNNRGNKNSIFNKQWFWTNLNEVKFQQGSSYSGNNYATYVAGVGGVGPTYVSGNIEEISLRPQEYTKVSQGFIVQAKYNNAPLVFANSMRVNSVANSIFYNKLENKLDDNEDEPDEPIEILDRYWLKFINPVNVANNILVAHISEATNDYDEDYDSALFSIGDDAFYSLIGTNKLQIQARALPITDSDVIALGYSNSKEGTCVIALNDKEGVFKTNGKAIYLKDNLTGTITNLQDNYYSFTSTAENNETRFSILYENTVLSTSTTKGQEVSVYKQNSEWVAKATSNILDVEVFDVSGRMIKNAKGNNTSEIRISNLGLTKGVYILKINTTKGIFTKKVLL